MQDKKNLLKAGQSCHANKGFKWKIEEISNKVKQKVVSVKTKLLSQSWKEFRREGFFSQTDLFM